MMAQGEDVRCADMKQTERPAYLTQKREEENTKNIGREEGGMSETPRVHQIINLLCPDGLDFVPEGCLERGARLHEAVEIWINNQIYGYTNESDIPQEVLPVIEWFSGQEVEFHGTEERLTHSLGFCGTPDILCRWKGVDYWIDLKFSESITLANRLQGTAYCYLTGRKGLFLQCNREGKVKAVKCKPDPKLWSAFLSGLNVKKFHVARDIKGREVFNGK